MLLCLVLINGCGESAHTEQEEAETALELQTEYIQVGNTDDIVTLTDSVVVPRLYSNIDGLDSLPLEVKKKKFVSALLPAVLVAKDRIYHQRQRLKKLLRQQSWTAEDSSFYIQLVTDYRTGDTTSLLSALQSHPNSIVLAQAAVESGWGNSRIFSEANNLFGIWSFSAREPRIPANIQRKGKTIYLRKYTDVSESISDYFKTIGRSVHYAKFRRARNRTDDVYQLIPHLINYSERREAYVDQLRIMIHYNKLRQYDHYRLDSAYYKVVSR